MVVTKKIVTGKAAAVKTAAPAPAAKGKKPLQPSDILARVLKTAKEPVVQRYLELIQLSTAGDLREKTERLFNFLEKRFSKAEPELEPLVQICDCAGWGHAAFATCPFCGDGEHDAVGKKLAKKAEKDGGEAAAVAMILRRWPEGFEHVEPPKPAPVVKTSAPALKEAKARKTRGQAAAEKAAALKIPVGEQASPPSAEELTVTFRQILKRHESKGGEGMTIELLIAEAGESWENPGTETLAWQAMEQLEVRGEAMRVEAIGETVRFKGLADGKLVGQIVDAFARALDAEVPSAVSLPALLDAIADDAGVEVHLDPEVDGELIKRAALQLVQSGRATRRGQMFVSTVERRMELPPEEPDADEQRAIREPEFAAPEREPEEEPEIIGEDEEGPVSDRSDTAIVLHGEAPSGGTVEELDAAIVEVHRLHATAAITVYDMGLLLHRIIEGKLFLQRRTITGHPVYETFVQFAKAELKITSGYAYQLAGLATRYTRVQIETVGPKKLTMLLAVTDKPVREELADKASTVGASQLKLEIEKVAPKPTSAPPPDGEPEDNDGDEAPPASAKPRPTAAKPASATPSKGPAATPTPREQRITVALVPGRQVIDLFARQPKPSSPLKRAKKIEQDPHGAIELGNGVKMEFRVYAGPGGLLQLAVETTRSGT